MTRPTTVERAYQLADTGEYGNAADVAAALSREDYLDAVAHLDGPTL